MSQPPDTESSTSSPSDFQARAEQRTPSLIGEFTAFLMHNKKWWLAPILLCLLAIGVLVLLTSSAAAPFIYTLF